MNQAWLVDVETERYVNLTEALYGSCGEVEPHADIVGYKVLWVDIVHHWLFEVLRGAALCNGGQVKAIEVGVLPECIFVLHLPMQDSIGEGRYTQVPNVWKHFASGLQEAVSCTEVALDHSLVEKEHPNGLRHQGVNLVRNLLPNLLDRFVYNLYSGVAQILPVGFGQHSHSLGHRRRLNRVHHRSTSLCCKEGQDATAGANIHDRGSIEVSRVLHDSLPISARTHAVLQHVLLIRQLGIILEVALNASLVERLEPLIVSLHLGKPLKELLCRYFTVPLQANVAKIGNVQQ
mmetsp:Transcript_94/g.254  ORF Transcript_94/g.254 Transcript_94/m.254 type:complete len:291 (+) Transcript_94:562-1434(+)